MCTSPLKAIFFGYKSNGKQNIHFCRNEEEYYNASEDMRLKLPCQQCVECRLKYSKMWATRCMLETKEHEHNYFITLTYDDEHLPTTINKMTGEVLPNLVPEHLTKFLKDLRRYYEYHFNWKGDEHYVTEFDEYDYIKYVNKKDDKGKPILDDKGKRITELKYVKIDNPGIRFYACGEYGEQLGRCHFHIILFNCPIQDKVFLGKSFRGDCYYTSPTLEKIWKNGFVSISDVTFESCAYVARYVMKKLKDKSNEELYQLMQEFSISKQEGIDLLGRTPEFVRMSRNPGIGRNYYENNKDKIYETDEIILPGVDGTPRVVKPPSYYDKLFDLESNGIMQQIKEKRKAVAIEAMKQVLSKTSLSEDEYFKVKERKKLNQSKLLPRKMKALNII